MLVTFGNCWSFGGPCWDEDSTGCLLVITLSIGFGFGSASICGRGGCPGVMGVGAGRRDTSCCWASHGRSVNGGGGCTSAVPILGGSLSE